MKTNDEILEGITCCTIEEDADLDIKENMYYNYEDVIMAMNQAREQYIILFKPYFLEYWECVKGVVDINGWVYSKEVPYLLDAYFETNTGKQIEFEKMYEYKGEWRGYRWRPIEISAI